MIVKKLEEKNLIVREKFGKTYKMYLSEWMKNLLAGDRGTYYSPEQQPPDSKEKED